MALDGDKVVLGTSIFGKKLRFVEAQKWDGKVQLQQAAEADLSVPLDYYAIGNRDLIPKFAEEIQNHLSENGLKAKQAQVALERRLVHLKRLQVDENLNDAEVRQHVEWELEQLLISSRDDYNVGYEEIAKTKAGFRNIVVVAVRKAIIHFLKDVFDLTPLELATVDVDLFAAIRGLRGEAAGVPQGTAALIEFHDRGVDFVLMHNGLYITSSELPTFRNEAEQEKVLDGFGEDLAILVNDELTRLLKSFDSTLIPNMLEKIFLAGEKADSSIIPYLQNFQSTAEIVFADSFKNVKWDPMRDPSIVIKESAEKFLAAVGMVLV